MPSQTEAIKIGIIGAAGYTGGELIRLLVTHPNADLRVLQSQSHAGQAVHAVHRDLYHLDESLIFAPQVELDELDLIFLCGGHGSSTQYMNSHVLPNHLKVIDLSQDFRYHADHRNFVYGLPELNREAIRQARFIANPGCFATAIQLALLPFCYRGLIRSPIHIHAITGSTGAGQKPSSTTHFSWRQNNLSVYKLFEHQHLDEISKSLSQLDPDYNDEIFFVPVRGCFTRGIFASLYFASDLENAELSSIVGDYYQNHPFSFPLPHDHTLDLKQVVGTNLAYMQAQSRKGMVHISCVIDNLIKGAAGQAVQNMNLMFDIPETAGLNLRSVAF